jgi:uncharacterized membrane protein YhhN
LKVKDFSKLYFAFLFFHLVVIYRPDEMLFNISKPLLMVSLLLFFLSKTESLAQKQKWFVSTALFFSLLGDVLMMQEGEAFFLLGMGAFAITHIYYLAFFYIMRSGPMNKALLILNIIGVVALILGLNELANIPKDMFLPINGYGIIIGLSLVLSVQFSYTNTFKSALVPLGVFLFIVSDFLLAIHKFQFQDLVIELSIMLSYGFAQYLIVLGVLRYFRKSED